MNPDQRPPPKPTLPPGRIIKEGSDKPEVSPGELQAAPSRYVYGTEAHLDLNAGWHRSLNAHDLSTLRAVETLSPESGNPVGFFGRPTWLA